MHTATTDPASLLRTALRANAGFSIGSGVVMTLAAAPVSSFLGVASPWWVAGVGLGLLLFAADLLRNAARPAPSLPSARLAVLGDLAWVAATAVVLALAPDTFSEAGRWTAIVVADIVFAFALAQSWGIRRVTRAVATS